MVVNNLHLLPARVTKDFISEKKRTNVSSKKDHSNKSFPVYGPPSFDEDMEIEEILEWIADVKKIF